MNFVKCANFRHVSKTQFSILKLRISQPGNYSLKAYNLLLIFYMGGRCLMLKHSIQVAPRHINYYFETSNIKKFYNPASYLFRLFSLASSSESAGSSPPPAAWATFPGAVSIAAVGLPSTGASGISSPKLMPISSNT